MKKIYKDGEVLEAADLNASLAELEEKIKNIFTLLTPEWKSVTMAPHWIALDGYQVEYCKLGDLVVLRGMVRRQTGGYENNILSVPEEARPKNTRFIPATVSNDGRPANLFIATDGRALIQGYSGAGSGIYNLPVAGSYYIN